MDNDTLLTLFTPTYNRAHLLGQLYQSILEQEGVDFEWLIVDDGSTDDTKDVVTQFIKENNNVLYLSTIFFSFSFETS